MELYDLRLGYKWREQAEHGRCTNSRLKSWLISAESISIACSIWDVSVHKAILMTAGNLCGGGDGGASFAATFDRTRTVPY